MDTWMTTAKPIEGQTQFALNHPNRMRLLEDVSVPWSGGRGSRNLHPKPKVTADWLPERVLTSKSSDGTAFHCRKVDTYPLIGLST